jgi:hypothetical protein
LKRHFGHCQVPWRHSIFAPHRRQSSISAFMDASLQDAGLDIWRNVEDVFAF